MVGLGMGIGTELGQRGKGSLQIGVLNQLVQCKNLICIHEKSRLIYCTGRWNRIIFEERAKCNVEPC